MSELSPSGGSDGYGACGDAGRGQGSGHRLQLIPFPTDTKAPGAGCAGPGCFWVQVLRPRWCAESCAAQAPQNRADNHRSLPSSRCSECAVSHSLQQLICGDPQHSGQHLQLNIRDKPLSTLDTLDRVFIHIDPGQ